MARPKRFKRPRWLKAPVWISRFLKRARELFPCTGVGLVVLAGASLALIHYGIGRLDLVLLVIGSVGLGVSVLAVVSTALTALFMWLAMRKLGREGGDVQLECGYPMATGFSLRNLWFVPLVSVTWTWSSPKAEVSIAKNRGRLYEKIIPLRRALSERVVRRFEVADIFGLCRIEFPVSQDRSVHFIPSVGRLKHMEVVHSLSGGDELSHPDGPPAGERMDIRNYHLGDPIRFILWKVFARTRQVVVRTPERAIGPVRQTVAYLVSGDGDEPAAGAARVAVEAGCLGGDWVLGADGDPEPARTRDEAMAAISRSSATPDDQQGAGLRGFLASAIPGTKLARALVFVPAIPGPWLDKVVAEAAQSGLPGRVELVVCCDGLVKKSVASTVGRLLKHPDEPIDPSALRPTSHAELREVLLTLSKARCALFVLDRQTGQVFTEGHLQQMLQAA